jgi:predicted transcriptional regulator
MEHFVSFKVGTELLSRIEAEAHRERRTRSDVIRLLIEDALTAKLNTTAGQAQELANAIGGKQ